MPRGEEIQQGEQQWMQSIAAVFCGPLFAAPSPQGWVQACCLVRPKQYRSPWKRIWERMSTISNWKPRPGLRDRQDGRVLLLVVAGVGSGIGPAGGTEDVGTVSGDGDGSGSRRREMVGLAHATPMHAPAGSTALELGKMT
jgi:hypothetical protein